MLGCCCWNVECCGVVRQKEVCGVLYRTCEAEFFELPPEAGTAKNSIAGRRRMIQEQSSIRLTAMVRATTVMRTDENVLLIFHAGRRRKLKNVRDREEHVATNDRRRAKWTKTKKRGR